MNEMARERQINQRYIFCYDGGNGTKLMEVDCSKATYNGCKVKNLDTQKRRKFENLLVITESPTRIKVKYNNLY